MKTLELPPEEWSRIAQILKQDEPIPDPQHSRILTVQNNDEIIATFASTPALLLTHLRVREDMRGRKIAEQLARRMIEIHPASTQAVMHTLNPHVEKLAFQIGMVPLKGAAWLWRGTRTE